MSNKQMNQLKDKYTVLQKQYTQLLEKNQNDLIAIRQKEKAIDITLANINSQREAIQTKLKHEINVLALQLEKMKHINGQKQRNQNQERQLQISKKEIQQLTIVLKLKDQRIQELECSVRKLIDQNMQLTADKTILKVDFDQINRENEVNLSKIQSLNKKINQIKQSKSNVKTQSTQSQQKIVQFSKLSQLQDKISSLIKTNESLNRQYHQKQSQNSILNENKINNLKQRLKETNEQLKRVVQRDKKTTLLLKKREEQMVRMQQQNDKMKKIKKVQKKKDNEDGVCLKCKEWQQQNKLLKEMVKSVQTMVRVREIEAERYKNHNTMGTPKMEKETKKSAEYFPPLKKQYL